MAKEILFFPEARQLFPKPHPDRNVAFAIISSTFFISCNSYFTLRVKHLGQIDFLYFARCNGLFMAF